MLRILFPYLSQPKLGHLMVPRFYIAVKMPFELPAFQQVSGFKFWLCFGFLFSGNVYPFSKGDGSSLKYLSSTTHVEDPC